jgi:hypothetical protein
MGGTCNMDGTDENSIHILSRRTRRKETVWEIKTKMRG